ncbi:MAG: hypothetical protein IPP94_04220 [Ignavibacteria bacterium]|nr:hypothetical protein [Ignavibacteria bacterium]
MDADRETSIRCGDAQLDALYPRIRGFLERSVTEYDLMGARIRGYRTPDAPSIWIRDYSDMMRGFKYFEKDLTSVATHFAETQNARGWLFDYVTMTPEKVPCERENWAKYVRVPVEADVEYRFVKAVHMAWQATGDDAWLRAMLPHMERALAYIMTDPWRWDARTGLVKRAFTVDTWDFDYTAGRHPWLNFQIDEHTFWGVMHGDNSGYYEAFTQMAQFYTHLRRSEAAGRWARRAEGLRRRTNALCFNGRFYAHRVPLVPCSIEGVDEAAQLSLSNPMDINRGMATPAMARSIIDEYMRRGESTSAFAPWFSIDPAFPAGMFGEEKIVPGSYCNGGIMPLVGGELARAAFEHGREEWAVAQLRRYEELTRDGSSFLWYFPDGRHATIETSTSPDASPTDSWGSSAMLYALMEGLAGITDESLLYRRTRIAPRWPAAGRDEARVDATYGPSGASVGYDYLHDAEARTITLLLRGSTEASLHVLLPPGAKRARAFAGTKELPVRISASGASRYADCALRVRGTRSVTVTYR